MTEAVGFIGLGNMGGPMVANLLAAGYDVTVVDTRAEAVEAAVAKGAKKAGSAKELADMVETVMICLPTPNIVEAVAVGPEGVINGSKIKTFIDLSTTGPEMAQKVAKALKEKNITALDAPVSGGVGGAIEATLAVMVAGPHNDYGNFKPMLEKIGKNVFYIGDQPGMGQLMKLINNMISAASMAITCEGVALGAKGGLDPQVMVDVLNASSGRTTASSAKFPKSILPRTFDYGFKAALQYKDVKLCMQAADMMQVPMFVGASVHQLWSYALREGGPDADITELMIRLEELAGTQVPKVEGND